MRLINRIQRIVLVVMLVAMLMLQSVPIVADTTVDITITAMPYVTCGILNFTITYVNDNRLDLSWGLSADTAKIMIRAKYGNYPNDIPDENTAPSDGYLVYYGNGLSVSDTSVALDDQGTEVYYKAWGQNLDGTWQTSFANNLVEGNMGTAVMIIGLIVIAITLTVCGLYLLRRVAITFMGGGFWLVSAAMAYTKSLAVGDVYFVIMWMSILGAIVTIMLALTVREKKDISEGESQLGEDDADFAEQHARQISYQKRLAQYDELTGGHRKKPSIWDNLKD